jgi:hypothetical protein
MKVVADGKGHENHFPEDGAQALFQGRRVKVVIFVPEKYGDAIRKAVGEAGAGKFGNYDFCSVSTKVTGYWRANKNANPHLGKIGCLESEVEEKIEFVSPVEILDTVLKAAKKVHPYEEMGCDLYRLLDARL